MRKGQDLTSLIERDLEGEARARVRLEALACIVSGIYTDQAWIHVMGELHSADGGRELARAVRVQAIAYDALGRMAATRWRDYDGSLDFGTYDVFKLEVQLPVPIEISRVRLLCAAR